MLRKLPATIVISLSLGATVDAQDRIYVDQYMPLRSEFMIADADGSNQRPLTDNHYEEGTPAWLPEEFVKLG